MFSTNLQLDYNMRNKPLSLTTVCGSSSLLSHVTVVPALTVDDVGWNMKSFTTIVSETSDDALDDIEVRARQTAAAATFETLPAV